MKKLFALLPLLMVGVTLAEEPVPADKEPDISDYHKKANGPFRAAAFCLNSSSDNVRYLIPSISAIMAGMYVRTHTMYIIPHPHAPK